ncbi:MAG: glycosyltransferase family 9 protein [Bdellovibrionales bacterium]|nr:glycosyltransferase family 9 protein [Bdellovibrionales bacterium]
MKVLLVSLLRIGDTLLALPLLESLRKSNPEIEIHILCNKGSSVLAPLMPFARFHYFERDELQKGLGEYNRPFFDSYFMLKELIDELNDEKFDRLINVTQNRLSGWLCGAIGAGEKTGLVLNRNGVPNFGSTWFSYLNDYVAAGGKEIFHYSDIFCYGAGVSPVNRYSLAETQEGRAEAELIFSGHLGQRILVQALTSDTKKNWSMEAWSEALRLLQIKNPQARFYLVGAPFEEKSLLSLQEMCLSKSIRAELALCSFAGAYSLLCRSDLLLTGDTSIKHLASATDCPVVEISVGSSDYRKTGTYRKGNVIIQSKEPCAPCQHTVACGYESHRCGDRLSPELIAMVAGAALSGNRKSLMLLAREFSSEAEILISDFSSSGYWMAEAYGDRPSVATIKKWIERSTWKMMLEKEHLRPVGEFGSEGRRLCMAVLQAHPKFKKEDIKRSLLALEKEAGLTENVVGGLLTKSRKLSSTHDGEAALKDMINLLYEECDRDDSGRVLLSYLSSLGGAQKDGVPDLARLRRIRGMLEEVKYKSTIRMKLIRSMQSQSMEML